MANLTFRATMGYTCHTTNLLLKACFRVLVLATMCVARALVWAAAAWPRRFGRLQRWRGMILSSAIPVMFFVPVAAVVFGGAWRDAARAAVGTYYPLPQCRRPWLLVAYRHVVEPVTLGVGMLHSLLLLAVCLIIVDPMFGQPQLLGLRAVPAAVVMAVLHLGVAAVREYDMQQRFARQLARHRCQ
jgi:hypothetical protein